MIVGRAQHHVSSRVRVAWITKRLTALLSALATLIVVVQLSGAGHVIADLTASPDVIAAHFASEDGGDCPPGCPSCHHTNGGVAATPPSPPADEAGEPPEIGPGTFGRPHAWVVPPQPNLPSVFRPPRPLAA